MEVEPRCQQRAEASEQTWSHSEGVLQIRSSCAIWQYHVWRYICFISICSKMKLARGMLNGELSVKCTVARWYGGPLAEGRRVPRAIDMLMMQWALHPWSLLLVGWLCLIYTSSNFTPRNINVSLHFSRHATSSRIVDDEQIYHSNFLDHVI